MAKAGAILLKLGRPDAGRKLIDEASRDAWQLPTERWAGVCRAQVARIVAAHDVDRALAIIEPFRAREADRWQALRASIAAASAATDTKRALDLVDTVGGPAFYHEMARTAIAYRIGRDRPDEAIRIIEGIHRNRWDHEWQAGALGWLAVALAPRDRARANGLIDRALTMMIDQRNLMGADDEMAVAARVATCARRIGYPGHGRRRDHAGAGGTVAGRFAKRLPGRSRAGTSGASWKRPSSWLCSIPRRAGRFSSRSRRGRGSHPVTPLEHLQAMADRLGPSSTSWRRHARSSRPSWRHAIERRKWNGSWTMGIFEMVELLTAPPDRREEVLGRRSAGGYWRPDDE